MTPKSLHRNYATVLYSVYTADVTALIFLAGISNT